MHTVVADSSSLIYLSKIALLPPFSRIGHLVISSQVYRECTHLFWFDDARRIKDLAHSGDINICPAPEAHRLSLPHFGTGEQNIIELCYYLQMSSMNFYYLFGFLRD